MVRTGLSPTASRGVLRLPIFSSRVPFRPSTLQTTPLRTLARRTYTSSSARTSPSPGTGFTFSSGRPSLHNPSLLQRLRNSFRSLHNSRARRKATNNGKPVSPNVTEMLGSPGGKAAAAEAEPTTLGGRMKKLGREYGWSAVGVYFLLSALDFPFCYLLVRNLGTDRIGRWEEIVLSNIKKLIPDSIQQFWHEWRASMKKAEQEISGGELISEGVEMAGWGVEEATEKNKKDASLATQLALAYAIHKSFIFIRVPITAAITPKVVKMLRGWGWDIGKRTTKEAKALKRASMPPKIKKARFAGRKLLK
ncbi:peptide alpha-N-acetyltransferase [Drepanopeziza brunnea f. sp. 'multigermtubi' MB_m1]|uniref:Peptide alpha-N-acetyltransferase n=1 Tax=Marssonina brunnea f. sp. multigermtubi (strain MB_m1) TaxID=1072389 RepID=K1XW51_MARBU|nr:peptide alpha-N-acetyltransferase [Drepanopeziza brunnea f. sp. 'multigermtubi' MB_m1]EKD16979.1 peptide alpha-N-acetyltransferase [Drepanopeziza brunnea f. sp. 'multigermtubi' MB_m1]